MYIEGIQIHRNYDDGAQNSIELKCSFVTALPLHSQLLPATHRFYKTQKIAKIFFLNNESKTKQFFFNK